MKKYIYITTCIILLGCSSLLDIDPLGSYNEDVLNDQTGIDALVVGAYSRLHAGGFNGLQNWVYGSLTAEDAYKGSEVGDQVDLNDIERYKTVASNGYPRDKWNTCYGNISACNRTIKMIDQTTNPDVTDDFKKIRKAEMRFLRGLNYIELKKVFNNVSWIDENHLENSKPISPNTVDIWPNIKADLKYATQNLPVKPTEVGRAYKWAAQAMLAKAYLFEHHYDSAKVLLDSIITYGTNAKGVKYGLVPNLYDIYNIANKNHQESVFALQSSVFDGANGNHGNAAMRLNYSYGGPGDCCGFYQPSYNLVNSYKVDKQGLPLFDTYNRENLKNDLGIKSDSAFTPDRTTPVDPRLDWTVGRRGIPYLDWGETKGFAWVRDQAYGGPYIPKKHMYLQTQKQFVEFDWSPRTAMNYEVIRYADVLLWAAECEIEVGDPNNAVDYVNQIRARAGLAGNLIKLDNGNLAANYQIGLYPSGAFADKEYARKAVRFERKLELAMEGHRFFDLVRWGVASEVLTTYINEESVRTSYLQGCTFVKGKHEYMPIPEEAIRQTMQDGKQTLTQNNGY